MKLDRTVDLRVPQHMANQPRPLPPDNLNPLDWEHYRLDLACWKAMKADCLLYGVLED